MNNKFNIIITLCIILFCSTNAHADKVTSYNAGVTEFKQKNYDEAVRLFQTSANQGYAPAQYRLGKTLVLGRRAPKNNQLGLELLHKAADQDNIGAIGLLSALYSTGKFDVELDHHKALKMYKHGASLGHKGSYHRLAGAYLNGRGVEKDFDQGLYWLCKSGDKESCKHVK